MNGSTQLGEQSQHQNLSCVNSVFGMDRQTNVPTSLYATHGRIPFASSIHQCNRPKVEQEAPIVRKPVPSQVECVSLRLLSTILRFRLCSLGDTSFPISFCLPSSSSDFTLPAILVCHGRRFRSVDKQPDLCRNHRTTQVRCQAPATSETIDC